jgi:hypothetical protein
VIRREGSVDERNKSKDNVKKKQQHYSVHYLLVMIWGNISCFEVKQKLLMICVEYATCNTTKTVAGCEGVRDV